MEKTRLVDTAINIQKTLSANFYYISMRNCKYCTEPSGTYELCKDHYYESKEGIIDKCKCGQFKDAEYDVCLDCYRKSKNSNGDRKKIRINDHSIKGRIAEAIVEEMFISLGYTVFRFGMENTVPGFSGRYLTRTGEVANQIRRMPDFIITKDTQTAFIETKYRTSGEFDFNEYYNSDEKYPYPNAYILLVSPKHIKIQKAQELEAGGKFEFLGSHRDFQTDKEIILQYIEFCKKFFANC